MISNNEIEDKVFLMTQHNSKRRNRRRNKSAEGEQRSIKEKFVEQRTIKPLVAKNHNQRVALKAFTLKQLVVLAGSAGVGKTELAVWWACKLWLEGKVDNIIITRPYKHLGADYGATRGNDSEKLLPFCMSILAKIKKYLGVGILRNNFKLEGFDNLFAEASGIQIMPVEKIQGMSFDERTIIIADEIQNTTVAQVKALTTRCEDGAQILICGDCQQTAIGGNNGLSFLLKCLERYPTEYAEVVNFTKEDVVRGGLAGHLVNVYENMSDTW